MPRAPRTPSTLDVAALDRVLAEQEGVVSRRQVLDLLGRSSDIRRRLRRREWALIHPGVYVNHTGRPTWKQRCWAAVLLYSPATLHRETALRVHGLTRDRSSAADATIHVMVEGRRTPRPTPGIIVERVRGAGTWTMTNRSPRVARLEFALLKVAADRDEAGAVALLSDACQQGRTTAARLVTTLVGLPRLPGRAALLEILSDVASGARSVLERRYLVEVERAHGLPAGERQLRAAGEKAVYRDVRYPGQHTIVELDGAFGHTDAEDRWCDLDRDLAAVLGEELTLRVGWGQVLDPCRLAALVAVILEKRGWQGCATPCGPDCPVPDRVDLVSEGDTNSTQSRESA
ncbi:hypothetical protein DDE18_21905 [Nocardioides gansuensis]|uniref:DUF559 domain-containing protein n=1 Tax=Nocardioides gansuensis TaxID=2138300 RepID=A0A2T8F4Q8_9ACTN|nr:hypothetical protein [Nocardioides gansuensis]PVG80659.1 hypothetical protein DDE18_21905 [Nocardioides gansuensis]